MEKASEKNEQKNRLIVTGAAGFIGFHLTKSLLDSGYYVLGIDNLNNYYDVNLKNARLSILQQNSNFIFKKFDICNLKELEKTFISFQPNKVINLAAQAGVRYSIKNPYAYLNSNLKGFLNIIELCCHNNVEGLIYASSSSVYGGNKKNPFSVNDRVDNPISFYAATKLANELIANSYSHMYGLHTTGLRYFTVYGSWGRPDMAMMIFIKKILAGEPISVFNHGNMKRDFTYINDIVSGTRSAIENNYKCEVFNLGNHKSENLMDMIRLIEKNIKRKAVIDFLPMQPGDVKESFADIKYTTKMLSWSPKIDIKTGIPIVIDWYKKYYIK